MDAGKKRRREGKKRKGGLADAVLVKSERLETQVRQRRVLRYGKL